MNKRGQFFLIAAIIIVAIILALSATINSVRVSGSEEAFLDLSKEIKDETKRVLDYGVVNEEDIESLITEDFLLDYVNYIAQEQVIFLYGDENDLKALIYESDSSGSVGIDTTDAVGQPISVNIENIDGGEIADVIVEGNRVTVTINQIDYRFTLREGQNFFFVIIKTKNDEKFVVQG